MTAMQTTVYIGLGSNLGEREAHLRSAVLRLTDLPGLKVAATSSIYETAAQEMAPGSPPFLNQVVKVESTLSPLDLLEALELVEAELGRTGKGLGLPRTIDLDILLYGDTVLATPRLTIPHPRLLARPFAIVPLLELSPALRHPATGRPLAEYRVSDAHVEKVQDHAARVV